MAWLLSLALYVLGVAVMSRHFQVLATVDLSDTPASAPTPVASWRLAVAWPLVAAALVVAECAVRLRRGGWAAVARPPINASR